MPHGVNALKQNMLISRFYLQPINRIYANKKYLTLSESTLSRWSYTWSLPSRVGLSSHRTMIIKEQRLYNHMSLCTYLCTKRSHASMSKFHQNCWPWLETINTNYFSSSSKVPLRCHGVSVSWALLSCRRRYVMQYLQALHKVCYCLETVWNKLYEWILKYSCWWFCNIKLIRF